MRTKPYVGIKNLGTREVFHATETPTEKTYGAKYNAVIGPFRTIRGAEFMRDYGMSNPHVQCVADAERLATLYRTPNEFFQADVLRRATENPQDFLLHVATTIHEFARDIGINGVARTNAEQEELWAIIAAHSQVSDLALSFPA